MGVALSMDAAAPAWRTTQKKIEGDSPAVSNNSDSEHKFQKMKGTEPLALLILSS